jgi:hypothetical protein
VPTPPASQPPPRTTQSRDDDDEDEDEDEDEEDDHDEDEEECEDDEHEDDDHGKKKKSWPWPHDESDGNETDFPTTNPLPDVLTKLGIEFQRTGRQPNLNDVLRILAEHFDRHRIPLDVENRPARPEQKSP